MSYPSTLPEEVLKAEHNLIATRHDTVVPPLETSGDTYTHGLALSGGGIRSASFNLGVLQAFYRSGLIRHFDYLSTISGGGYIGSYFTSLLASKPDPLSSDNPAISSQLRAGPTGLQPLRIQRFVRNGRYLFRPLTFLNSYLLGLLLNNLAIATFLAFATATLAFSWRMLDSAIAPNILYDATHEFGPLPLWKYFSLTSLASWLALVLVTRHITTLPRHLGLFVILCLAVATIHAYYFVETKASLAVIAALTSYPLLTSAMLLALAIVLYCTIRFLIHLALIALAPLLLPAMAQYYFRPANKHQSEKVTPLVPGQNQSRFVRLITKYYFALRPALTLAAAAPLLIAAILLSATIGAGTVFAFQKLVHWDIRITEAMRPLLPAIGFFTLWLAVIMFVRQSTKAKAVILAKWFLWLSVGSLAVGLVVVAATPHARLWVASEEAPQSQQNFLPGNENYWKTAIGILLTALIPLARPERFLQSGISPRTYWEGWIFKITTSFLFVGIPLAATWYFARHGIAGTAAIRQVLPLPDDKDPPPHCPFALHSNDIDFDKWRLFWSRVVAERKTPYSPGAFLWNALSPASQSAILTISEKDPEDNGATTHASSPKSLMDEICKSPEPLDPNARVQKHQIVQELNRGVISSLGASAFYKHIIVFVFPSSFSTTQELGYLLSQSTSPKRLSALVSLAMLARLTPLEEMELNRLLLEAVYPTHCVWPIDIVRRSVVIKDDQQKRLRIAGLMFFLFVGACVFVNVNITSMHDYYRDRLDRAFVADPSGVPIPLANVDSTSKGGPLHLWGAAHTCVPSLAQYFTASETRRDDGPDALLHLPGRVEHFLFSQSYTGSAQLGYHPTAQYLGKRFLLADAMAISGAAISPVQIDNSLIVFMMFALNLRLGQWLPNPFCESEPVSNRDRPLLGRVLGSWVFGLNTSQSPFSMLSDGGHFDNTGAWALLQRRAKIIVLSDATCDSGIAFAEFVRLIRRARAEAGIQIYPANGKPGDPLPLSSLRPFPPIDSYHKGLLTRVFGAVRSKLDGSTDPKVEDNLYPKPSQQHFILARIRYPESLDDSSFLIYMKPTLTGDEPVDLQLYASGHPDFPHDPTANAFFDPDCFESYRQLGYHVGSQVYSQIASCVPQDPIRLDDKAALWSVGPRALLDAVGKWFERPDHATCKL